jgi:hypothetical protein
MIGNVGKSWQGTTDDERCHKKVYMHCEGGKTTCARLANPLGQHFKALKVFKIFNG